MKSVVLLLALVPGVVWADTSTGNFQATTTVPANCTVQTIQNIDFGNWDAFGAQATQWTAAQGMIQWSIAFYSCLLVFCQQFFTSRFDFQARLSKIGSSILS